MNTLMNNIIIMIIINSKAIKTIIQLALSPKKKNKIYLKRTYQLILYNTVLIDGTNTQTTQNILYTNNRNNKKNDKRMKNNQLVSATAVDPASHNQIDTVHLANTISTVIKQKTIEITLVSGYYHPLLPVVYSQLNNINIHLLIQLSIRLHVVDLNWLCCFIIRLIGSWGLRGRVISKIILLGRSIRYLYLIVIRLRLKSILLWTTLLYKHYSKIICNHIKLYYFFIFYFYSIFILFLFFHLSHKYNLYNLKCLERKRLLKQK